MLQKKIFGAKGIMLLIYGVGIIGMAVPFLRPYFLNLTPITLLISAALLFYFHREWNRAFFALTAIVYLAGFAIEAVGVATGSIFGTYSYSDVLGPKLLDTPLIIGINWLMLIYATGTIAGNLKSSVFVKALAGAVLMLTLDFVLEPVAISLNFWEWPEDLVPLTNYIAWFTISFFLLLAFYFLPFRKGNPLALFLYLLQLAFFICLSILK